jgi:hypothetical protein
MAIERLEYKVTFRPPALGRIDWSGLENECNKLAADGWRLAAATGWDRILTLFWERPIR